MPLKTSKYSKAPKKTSQKRDTTPNKMAFNRASTAPQFEAREIADDSYQLSRKQQSYQNKRKMDKLRPTVNAREEGGQA